MCWLLLVRKKKRFPWVKQWLSRSGSSYPQDAPTLPRGGLSSSPLVATSSISPSTGSVSHISWWHIYNHKTPHRGAGQVYGTSGDCIVRAAWRLCAQYDLNGVQFGRASVYSPRLKEKFVLYRLIVNSDKNTAARLVTRGNLEEFKCTIHPFLICARRKETNTFN